MIPFMIRFMIVSWVVSSRSRLCFDPYFCSFHSTRMISTTNSTTNSTKNSTVHSPLHGLRHFRQTCERFQVPLCGAKGPVTVLSTSLWVVLHEAGADIGSDISGYGANTAGAGRPTGGAVHPNLAQKVPPARYLRHSSPLMIALKNCSMWSQDS